MSKKLDRRGGRRKGAGRPKEKKIISEDVKKNYQRAAKELSEEYGESIEKAGLRLIFKDGVQDSVKVAALKEYGQVLVSKENKQTEPEDSEPESYPLTVIVSKEEMAAYNLLKSRWDELTKAVIILPEQQSDPAKEILSKKKPKKNKVIRLDEKK